MACDTNLTDDSNIASDANATDNSNMASDAYAADNNIMPNDSNPTTIATKIVTLTLQTEPGGGTTARGRGRSQLVDHSPSWAVPG